VPCALALSLSRNAEPLKQDARSVASPRIGLASRRLSSQRSPPRAPHAPCGREGRRYSAGAGDHPRRYRRAAVRGPDPALTGPGRADSIGGPESHAPAHLEDAARWINCIGLAIAAPRGCRGRLRDPRLEETHVQQGHSTATVRPTAGEWHARARAAFEAAPHSSRRREQAAGLAIGRRDRAPARRALDRNEEGKVRRDRREEAAGGAPDCRRCRRRHRGAQAPPQTSTGPRAAGHRTRAGDPHGHHGPTARERQLPGWWRHDEHPNDLERQRRRAATQHPLRPRGPSDLRVSAVALGSLTSCWSDGRDARSPRRRS